MEVGSIVGYKLATANSKWYIIVIGFILGVVTMLAEPAVYVLTHQIEDVTSNMLKELRYNSSMYWCWLCNFSIHDKNNSTEIQLWHYLLPGYIISIAMSYFCTKTLCRDCI